MKMTIAIEEIMKQIKGTEWKSTEPLIRPMADKEIQQTGGVK